METNSPVELLELIQQAAHPIDEHGEELPVSGADFLAYVSDLLPPTYTPREGFKLVTVSNELGDSIQVEVEDFPDGQSLGTVIIDGCRCHLTRIDRPKEWDWDMCVDEEFIRNPQQIQTDHTGGTFILSPKCN